MKDIELLGTYEVAVPPNMGSTDKLKFLVQQGQEIAEEEGYELCAIVPIKHGRKWNLKVFVYEE